MKLFVTRSQKELAAAEAYYQSLTYEDIDRAENADIKRAMGMGEGQYEYLRLRGLYDAIREAKRRVDDKNGDK